MAHIINLATQAIIFVKSKAKHYDPHNLDAHLPDMTVHIRDELGLVRAICVKAQSSSQCKALFQNIQLRVNSQKELVQLLLDMKVWWGSTKVMLSQTLSLKDVCILQVLSDGLDNPI